MDMKMLINMCKCLQAFFWMTNFCSSLQKHCRMTKQQYLNMEFEVCDAFFLRNAVFGGGACKKGRIGNSVTVDNGNISVWATLSEEEPPMLPREQCAIRHRVIHYIAKVASRRAMEKSSSACGIVRRMGSLVIVWCIHLITLRSVRWPRLPIWFWRTRSPHTMHPHHVHGDHREACPFVSRTGTRALTLFYGEPTYF